MWIKITENLYTNMYFSPLKIHNVALKQEHKKLLETHNIITEKKYKFDRVYCKTCEIDIMLMLFDKNTIIYIYDHNNMLAELSSCENMIMNKACK